MKCKTITRAKLEKLAREACLDAGDSWIADGGAQDIYMHLVWVRLGRPKII